MIDPATGADLSFEIGLPQIEHSSNPSQSLDFNQSPSNSEQIGMTTLLDQGTTAPFALGADADTIALTFSVKGNNPSQLFQNGLGTMALQLVNQQAGTVVGEFGKQDVSEIPVGQKKFYALSVAVKSIALASPSTQFVVRPAVVGLKSNPGYVASLGHIYRGMDVPVEKISVDFNSLSRSEGIPTKYELGQSFPNPFNPTTDVRYAICDVSHVTLKVYDVLGREVATLVNEVKQPGEYAVMWDASNMPSGVYFYRLQAGKFSDVKKMLLCK